MVLFAPMIRYSSSLRIYIVNAICRDFDNSLKFELGARIKEFETNKVGKN